MSYATRQRVSGAFQLVIIGVMLVFAAVALQGCATCRGIGYDLASFAEGGAQSVSAPVRVGVRNEESGAVETRSAR